MTATEALERRIDELCAEVERLRLRHEGYVVDLQEALAENARLRQDNDRLIQAIEDLHDVRLEDRLVQLENSNDRLRELCKDMMAFVEDDDACERCGHDAECVEAADGELVLPYEGRCLMLDLFADRMRELGVEVDG